jgi:hypothetical protein
LCLLTAWSSQQIRAQYVETNPLEWLALAEGNELINSEIESQVNNQTETVLLQSSIAAEFTQMKEWERKYSSYLKTVDGYASSLKAAETLYADGVRIFIALGKIRKAVNDHPQGVFASIIITNLYFEVGSELVSVYTLLQNAIASGGKTNMLSGTERSELMWALADKLTALNKSLNRLHLCIRYYTMTDVWNQYTAGMIDRDAGEIANDALKRWKRAARAIR